MFVALLVYSYLVYCQSCKTNCMYKYAYWYVIWNTNNNTGICIFLPFFLKSVLFLFIKNCWLLYLRRGQPHWYWCLPFPFIFSCALFNLKSMQIFAMKSHNRILLRWISLDIQTPHHHVNHANILKILVIYLLST